MAQSIYKPEACMATLSGETQAKDISNIVCTKSDAAALARELQPLYKTPVSITQGTENYVFPEGENRRVWLITTTVAGGTATGRNVQEFRRDAQIKHSGTGGSVFQNIEKVEKTVMDKIQEVRHHHKSVSGAIVSPSGDFVEADPAYPKSHPAGEWADEHQIQKDPRVDIPMTLGNAEELRAAKFAGGVGAAGQWAVDPLRWILK